MERLDSDYIEKLITKAMLCDKNFLVLISGVFEREYFNDTAVSTIFEFSKSHMEEFKTIPPREAITHSIQDESIQKDVEELFGEVDSIEFNISANYDYLLKETNEYLKEQAIKRAIVESVDIVDNRDQREQIREKIESALCKDIKVDLGLSYFEDLGKRLRRIFTATDVRIPTYFPKFDEYINGGFPPFTLSVIVARIHGMKSNTMANMAARQVLHGHNVALLSLEMAQDAFAQRFDSMYSKMDINRMYHSDTNKRSLMNKLKIVKEQEGRGELFIKQFPTGGASVRDFRTYLRELIIRGVKISIIYVDYINLMKAASAVSGGNMYQSVKMIAEELRALSFEFEVPVVSVSQLNREGSFVGFEQLDFTYIAESMGLPATSDFMGIYGVDEDAMVYQNEVHYKIVKNRLGGQVGSIDKLYYDARTLAMYDSTEMDLWLSDSQITGDSRDAAVPRERNDNDNRRGGRR